MLEKSLDHCATLHCLTETERLFSLLNMRSAIDSKDRLVEVAIEVLAREGFSGTSLRMIAIEAGVSPALLVHHFGSRQALIEEAINKALGEWMKSKDELTEAAQLSLSDAIAQWPQAAEDGKLKLEFFRQVMIAGGKPAEHLFAQMVSEAKLRLEKFAASGLMRSLSDPDTAAVLLAAYGLAPLMLAGPIKKLLGAEFTDPKISETLANSSVELFGLFLPSAVDSTVAGKAEEKAGEK